MTDPFGWDPMQDPLYAASMMHPAQTPAAAPTPMAAPQAMPTAAASPMATPMATPMAAPQMVRRAPMAAAPMAAPAQVTPAPGFLHTVVAGDTIWKLAQRYGTTVDAIIAANPGIVPENLLIGSVLRIPVPAVTYIRYTVKPGDTLWLIGQQYGVPWQELARINRIMDPMNLMVGTVLLIPVA